ncbi:uncharacterized protein LOC114445089 [Parambassis ranga]|uniref:Uncharacterized protein LOC114445089 n=1 Tax=Parambassis ranga TaxID=210632 RepID=A0A6P7JJT0_9TELE|nr:uncharacterized protein LOC114445089 [Parambassis ranga]
MYNYLLSAMTCFGIIYTGLCLEQCHKGVFARRDTFYVPVGGSLSLSCVVQHCGDTWTGTWVWTNSSESPNAVKETVRWRMINVTVSGNETKLVLKIEGVQKLDEGAFRCSATWGEGFTDMGHWMYINVTAAVPLQRQVLHRVLVCAGACLCLPIILGLARCLSSKAKPQPLPRKHIPCTASYRNPPQSAPQPPPRRPQKRNTSSHKAPLRPQQNTEVVYADISQAALRGEGATRQPAPSTVYSSVKFS